MVDFIVGIHSARREQAVEDDKGERGPKRERSVGKRIKRGRTIILAVRA